MDICQERIKNFSYLYLVYGNISQLNKTNKGVKISDEKFTAELNENKRDMLGMSPVAGYAPKMEEALNNFSNGYYRGQEFVLVGDVHLNMDFTYRFAIEFAKRNNMAFATELIQPWAQPYLDAFATGRMGRTELMKLCSDFLTYEGSETPPKSHPQYYMGLERGKRLYDDILDAIEEGVPVYAVGTVNSLLGDKETPELRKMTNQAGLMATEIVLESYLKLKAEGGKEITEIPEATLAEHPKYSRFLDLKEKLFKATLIVGEKEVKESNEAEGLSIENRLQDDHNVAAMLENISAKHPGGVVGIYGTLHMSQNGFWNQDIDQNLRNHGHNVLIVDPVLDKTPPYSPFICKEEDDECKEDSGQIIKEYQEKVALEAFDPNRVIVNLDTAETYRTDPVIRSLRKFVESLFTQNADDTTAKPSLSNAGGEAPPKPQQEPALAQ